MARFCLSITGAVYELPEVLQSFADCCYDVDFDDDPPPVPATDDDEIPAAEHAPDSEDDAE